MNAVSLVIVSLEEILTEIGIPENKLEGTMDKVNEYLEDEADGVPDSEGFISYLEDEELLKGALKKAKVDQAKFDAAIEKVSHENNDLPVYVIV